VAERRSDDPSDAGNPLVDNVAGRNFAPPPVSGVTIASHLKTPAGVRIYDVRTYQVVEVRGDAGTVVVLRDRPEQPFARELQDLRAEGWEVLSVVPAPPTGLMVVLRREPSRPTNVKPVRVLVVEDHDDSRELLRGLVEFSRGAVVAVSSVAEALAVLKETEVDLVLSDIGLPDVDGFELARQLRAHPRRKQMRVVAVSGFLHHDPGALAEAGFDGLLAKPVLLEQLIGVLQDCSQE
jgi:CheY-like chemotaxis protein